MKKKKTILWGVVGVLLILVVVALFNREYCLDKFRAMSYQPSEEMSRIMNALELTGEGEFLFRASQPALNGRGEFNAHCRTDVGVESAILGCYVDKDIYVYDVDAVELDGIKELTTAHELLHAVWARMSESERRGLTENLTKVFEQNQEVLGSEIDNYDLGEKQEELYVRVGTEVANLPAELEKHYAEIFKNQDVVVGFYNKYITVFRRIWTELEDLEEQLGDLNVEIESKTSEYRARAGQLQSDVLSFNECAQTAGCFNSQWAFNTRRNELLTEREMLEGMYAELNEMVKKYNELVEKYNADVLYNDKLNNMINSSTEPVVVE